MIYAGAIRALNAGTLVPVDQREDVFYQMHIENIYCTYIHFDACELVWGLDVVVHTHTKKKKSRGRGVVLYIPVHSHQYIYSLQNLFPNPPITLIVSFS